MGDSDSMVGLVGRAGASVGSPPQTTCAEASARARSTGGSRIASPVFYARWAAAQARRRSSSPRIAARSRGLLIERRLVPELGAERVELGDAIEIRRWSESVVVEQIEQKADRVRAREVDPVCRENRF
jgi:hypothetical protein